MPRVHQQQRGDRSVVAVCLPKVRAYERRELICGVAASVISVTAEASTAAPANFTFKDATGKERSVAVVDKFQAIWQH